MVTNPPWGERMTGDGDIDQLYREVGQTLATTFDGNRKFVLLGEDASQRLQRVKRERWVHNGPIQCRWVDLENRAAKK